MQNYPACVEANNYGNEHANIEHQVFSEKELLGVVKVNSPALGGFRKFIASPFGLVVLLLIPAFFVIISCGIDVYRARKEPEEKEAAPLSGSTPTLSEEDKKRPI